MTVQQPPSIRPPEPRRRSTTAVVVDIVVASVLWGVLLLGSGIAVFYAVMYFTWGLDGCVTGRPCAARDQAEHAVYLVCLGVAVAGVIAAVGTLTCALLRRAVWCWPLIGLLIAGGATWWGVRIAQAAGGLG